MTVANVILIIALVLTVLSALGHCPLWIPVLAVIIALLFGSRKFGG